jgi:hypothetical protein
MSKPTSAAYSDKDYQAEDDMRTLMRAEEVRRDPKRLAAARECAKKKLQEVAVVAAIPTPEK